MDIKAKIEELTSKFKDDPDLLSKFKEDPIKTVEGILGVDLPDEQIKAIVEGIKAKLNIGETADKIGDKLGGIGEKITGIFKKD